MAATDVESGNMVFKAAKIVRLIEAFKTAVPLHDVPDYLGANKRQVEFLYRASVLIQLVPRTGRGSVRHVVFALKDLEDILSKLYVFPELVPEVGQTLHLLAYACQRGAGPFEDVFADVLSGQIPSFRYPEKSGVGAIYVDVDAVLEMKKSA